MLQYVMLALSAVNAITSIKQGYDEKKEYGYNADLLGYKAGLIDVQKDIEYAKFERLKARSYGTALVNIGGMGIKASGSALAVMLDAQRQMTIDQTIGQFNLDMEKRFTMAEAGAQDRAGDRAVRMGYSKGLSSILSGAWEYGKYSKGINTGSKTTNTVTKAPKIPKVSARSAPSSYTWSI